METILPGFETLSVKANDIVYTPANIAKAVVEWAKPEGSMLDPCKGRGVFLENMPGAEWCEITEGRDFFKWEDEVDWIISNPPYSIFSEFCRHSFKVAQNIVYLIPINKAFNSSKMMRDIWSWGGIVKVLVFGSGGELGFPIGFCIGAVHFSRGYKGGMTIEFYESNSQS